MTNEMMILDESNVFLSLKADEDKKIIANAIVSADHKLGDYINKVIRVTDVYVEPTTFINDETGETSTGHRVILFDENKISYETCSTGVFNALKRIISVYGLPTWDEPLEMEIKQVQRKERKIMTLKIV